MKRSGTALRVAISAAVAGGVGLVQSAVGQDRVEEPAGLRVALDYSTGIDIDSNYRLDDESPGTYAAWVNGLEFALLSNTRNQSFELRFGTELRLAQDPGSNQTDHIEWTDPNFLVLYTRESANSRLTLSTDMVIRQVDTLQPFFLDADGDAIVDDSAFDATQGTLTEFGARATLETGLNSPIGTTYLLAYQSRTYNDTDDPGLYDREDFILETNTRLRFSPVTTGIVNLAARQYEYSQGRVLLGQNYSASVGAIHEFSPVTSGEVSIGYAKVREEEDIGGIDVIDVSHGVVGSADLTRELPNGAIYGEFDRELLEDSFRNELTFGRTIEMARYDLDASVGVANLDGGDTYPIFGLSYRRSLRDGLLTASLDRNVTLNTDNEQRVVTAGFLEYSREINEVSSFSLGLDYSLVTGLGNGDVDDETRTTFIASYQHALTEDWAMTVGYQGRTRSDDDEDAISNAVFVYLGRRFVFR